MSDALRLQPLRRRALDMHVVSLARPKGRLRVDVAPRLQYLRFEEPPRRQAGIKVGSVQDLVVKLKNDAGVL